MVGDLPTNLAQRTIQSHLQELTVAERVDGDGLVVGLRFFFFCGGLGAVAGFLFISIIKLFEGFL